MKHTLTLTRWHKVAERINAALKERGQADGRKNLPPSTRPPTLSKVYLI